MNGPIKMCALMATKCKTYKDTVIIGTGCVLCGVRKGISYDQFNLIIVLY